MATRQEGGFSNRVVSAWRRQDGSQPRCFVGRQGVRGFFEVVTGSSFNTIDALPPFNDIEVQLEDTFLCEMLFERTGNQCFPRLSKQGTLR